MKMKHMLTALLLMMTLLFTLPAFAVTPGGPPEVFNLLMRGTWITTNAYGAQATYASDDAATVANTLSVGPLTDPIPDRVWSGIKWYDSSPVMVMWVNAVGKLVGRLEFRATLSNGAWENTGQVDFWMSLSEVSRSTNGIVTFQGSWTTLVGYGMCDWWDGSGIVSAKAQIVPQPGAVNPARLIFAGDSASNLILSGQMGAWMAGEVNPNPPKNFTLRFGGAFATADANPPNVGTNTAMSEYRVSGAVTCSTLPWRGGLNEPLPTSQNWVAIEKDEKYSNLRLKTGSYGTYNGVMRLRVRGYTGAGGFGDSPDGWLDLIVVLTEKNRDPATGRVWFNGSWQTMGGTGIYSKFQGSGKVTSGMAKYVQYLSEKNPEGLTFTADNVGLEDATTSLELEGMMLIPPQ